MDLGRGVSTSVIVVPAAPDNHLAIDRPAKKGLKSLALDLPKSLGAVRSDLMQISKQDEGRRTLYIEKGVAAPDSGLNGPEVRCPTLRNNDKGAATRP